MKISDFNISGAPIPESVADRILEYHLLPMQEVCKEINATVSLKSGYRSLEWERLHNRTGSSQHCFGEQTDGNFDERVKGAVDWTCDNFTSNKDELLSLMVKHTTYTRFCMYNSFIHADHKPTNARQLFEFGQVRKVGKWIFKEFV